MYRISDPEELYELGLEDYLYGQGVSIIEWADLILDLLPLETQLVELRYTPNMEAREYRTLSLKEYLAAEGKV